MSGTDTTGPDRTGPDRAHADRTGPGGRTRAGRRAAAAGADSPLGRVLARAAVLTAVLTATGSLLGLLRDQTIARLFGAGSATDAFLVAWTLPELAATLLIEDAMALLLVPAFSLALARRAALSGPAAGHPQAPGDPVRELLAATFPRLAATLAASAALLAAAAPWLVRALAPGLADPGLAVECTRLTALTVLAFGIAGYFSAALRAHRCFAPPAAIYAAYNLAVIVTVLAAHPWLGVRGAALGVALGGGLMAVVQLPAVLRHLPVRAGLASGCRAGRARRARGGGRRRAGRERRPPGRPALLGVGLLAPVILFAVSRQSQVLIERYLASSLPAGAISHLNYAQKVAQLPMVLSLMICTVTFPVVARAMADGAAGDVRRRVERDLHLAAVVVLLGAAYVLACAPQLVRVLFERGAFEAGDTAATASVMRVYALGLLGHSLVGALVRPFFSASRPTWYPAVAMGTGLLVTVLAGALAAPHWGTHGIAAANAAGITVSAALLLHGLATRVVPFPAGRMTAGLARLVLTAALAAAAGWAAAAACPHPLGAAVAAGAATCAAFAAAGTCLRAPEVSRLTAAALRRGRLLPARRDRRTEESDHAR
ncbi:lipid II flippase MurJ [Streptomyces sp. TRM 70351]|uniref:lipid II flippase MurJ n=1 Tax=Streptomyces sp. TRM 70351 TaxID=3116552 RepID=UPI002E7B5C11|nr:lipid II flippase MurJ [Streptomyces sp. TRM 70351]MEE1929216.1 lipid II flippase MurJ [Streptomyces sp. TRM 70351]